MKDYYLAWTHATDNNINNSTLWTNWASILFTQRDQCGMKFPESLLGLRGLLNILSSYSD